MSRKKRVSTRRLKGFVKEERATSRLYARLGYKKQAKQEKEHADFFEKQLKKQRGRYL